MCGGLGLQLGIDPTIVRVAMVVLTIAGGVGIPLYIILALLMPNEGSDSTTVGNAVGPHLPEQVRSGPGLAILVVVVALIFGAISGGTFNNQFWDHGGWPWPLIAAAVIGWLVYRKRKHNGTPAGTGGTRAAVATAQPPAGYRADVPADPADPGAPGPEFWSRPDPLGLYDPPAGVVAPAPLRTVSSHVAAGASSRRARYHQAAARIGEVYTKGALTLARSRPGGPDRHVLPAGPVLRNVPQGARGARLYPDRRPEQARVPAQISR